MHVASSPMARRIRTTNAARLQAELNESNGDGTPPNHSEGQVPQHEDGTGEVYSFDVNGDRLEDDDEEEIDENAPGEIPRRSAAAPHGTGGQRVLFGEPGPAIVIVDSNQSSVDGPE